MRQRRRFRRAYCGILVAAMLPVLAIGGEGGDATASKDQDGRRPQLEQLDEDRYRLGQVELNRKEKTLRFPALLHLREEPIEYALVHQTGKAHESLLLTEVSAYTVHLAGLLLGAKKADVVKPEAANGSRDADEPASSGAGRIRDPEERTFSGNSLKIWVEWEASKAPSDGVEGDSSRNPAVLQDDRKDAASGKESSEPGAPTGRDDLRRVRLEQWIRNEAADDAMEAQRWIYNGSRFLYGHFMAQREGSIVAIISDPNALINSSHPDRANDEIWRPNTKELPAHKTEVSVIIKIAASGNDE